VLTHPIDRFQLPAAAHYLTVKAAADLLCRHPKTLQSWRHAGIGPAWIRLGPRCVAYRFEDVQTWLEANRHEQAA